MHLNTIQINAHMKINFFLFALLFNFLTTQAQSVYKQLSLQDVVDGVYFVKNIGEIRSLPDGEHYTMLNKEGTKILKYSYKTGQIVETLFDAANTRETTIEKIEGYLISPNTFRIIVWNEKEHIYRRSWKALCYDYDVRRNFLKPFNEDGDKIINPTFSPDGRMCSYIKDNNIWLKKFDFDTESIVTKDGAFGKIINGLSDWVYEEEFSITNLMAWSPDSKFLSFVKFDESSVKQFSFQKFDGSLYPSSLVFKYPKAGEDNALVSCLSYSVETKDIKTMKIPIDTDGYIPLIKYTAKNDQLAVMSLNRQQNIFSLYYVNPQSGLARLVLREENKSYIDSELLKHITFTDNSFVYLSEKDGFTHIYLYSAAGVLQRQVSKGTWDVTDFYGYNPATENFYFQSAEESPLRRSVYRIDAKGIKTRISEKTGTNTASFSSNLSYFINTYSNANTPQQITINDSRGKEIHSLEENLELNKKIKDAAFCKKEFFTITNQEGQELNAWMLKPNDFSVSKKYPVLMTQYSGPNSQQVLDRFSLGFNEYMSDKGYIVVCVDGRGTGARGESFRKSTYQQLGIQESDDQIAAAKHLGSLPFVDKERISIWGWSYGGTITLMSLSRGNGVFSAGIAVAPVTDWKLYDSVYTERFMRSPKENFAGYKQASPINHVDNLQGRLLLVHGTADDNVHFQNSMYYADALVDAGKQFDMQIYSDKNHSLLGTKTRFHLFNRLEGFLK